jgi:hypothetical protein
MGLKVGLVGSFDLLFVNNYYHGKTKQEAERRINEMLKSIK